MISKRHARFTLVLGPWFVSACVSVPAYKREAFTQPGMDPSVEATAAPFEAHVHDSRQGASASQGSTGGGCGCN